MTCQISGREKPDLCLLRVIFTSKHFRISSSAGPRDKVTFSGASEIWVTNMWAMTRHCKSIKIWRYSVANDTHSFLFSHCLLTTAESKYYYHRIVNEEKIGICCQYPYFSPKNLVPCTKLHGVKHRKDAVFKSNSSMNTTRYRVFFCNSFYENLSLDTVQVKIILRIMKR